MGQLHLGYRSLSYLDFSKTMELNNIYRGSWREIQFLKHSKLITLGRFSLVLVKQKSILPIIKKRSDAKLKKSTKESIPQDCF